MFVPFETIAGHSRVWIYQASRRISSSEAATISEQLTAFTEQWQVHGQPMRTSFSLYFDHFIVLAADEGYNAASGCSIDGSVRVLKALGEELAIDFFDRTKVAFLKNGNVEIVPLNTLKQNYKDGIWNGQTTTFNNLVGTVDELKSKWQIPASASWLNRYISTEATIA